jgi:sugar-specific transcriptional regulator TrmB
MNEETAQLLAEIGFTRLEAMTYLHLIQEPSVTGYRVAQAIGKPVPNVYKALESLQKKGAILCDESAAHRRYVAQPIAGFLQQLHDQLTETGHRIEEQLADLPALRIEEGVFRLEHTGHAYERARLMIGEAELVVMADACPAQLEQLCEPFEQSARTGIEVSVKAYSRTDLSGCRVVCSEEMGSPRGLWPVEWLHLCVDGRQQLTALFESRTRQLVHGLWCKDTFLSAVAYNGLLAELVTTSIMQKIEGGGSAEEIRSVLRDYESVRTRSLPALQTLISSFVDHLGGQDNA